MTKEGEREGWRDGGMDGESKRTVEEEERPFLLLPNVLRSSPPHRSRSGSKIELRFQQKFQWDMKFWGKKYQKT